MTASDSRFARRAVPDGAADTSVKIWLAVIGATLGAFMAFALVASLLLKKPDHLEAGAAH